MQSEEIIEMTEAYGAMNYKPLPIVIAKAEGVWVEDPEGKRYLDFPEKNYCCYCCDAAHGCGILKPDWISDATYEGQ